MELFGHAFKKVGGARIVDPGGTAAGQVVVDGIEHATLLDGAMTSSSSDHDEKLLIRLRSLTSHPAALASIVAVVVTFLLLPIRMANITAVDSRTPVGGCNGETVDGVCWRLSAAGESCASLCGSGSAVDAETTVRGSSTLIVQDTVLPGWEQLLSKGSDAETVESDVCGWPELRFPYSGLTMYDSKLHTWECASDGSFVHVPRPELRSPCVCAAPPPVRATAAVVTGTCLGLLAPLAAFAIGAGADHISAQATMMRGESLSSLPTAGMVTVPGTSLPTSNEPMSEVKRVLTTAAAVLSLVDVTSDLLVLRSYLFAGERLYALLSLGILLTSSAGRALIASNALYPSIEGLDFGELQTVDPRYHGQTKQWLVHFRHYDRRISPGLAALVGAMGLSTAAQAVNDVVRGVASTGLDDMKLFEALSEAAPQLFLVLTAMTSRGLRYTYATQPVQLLSACSSTLVLALGVALAWRRTALPRTLRLYAAAAQRVLPLIGSLVYVLASVALRGLAISMAASSMSWPQVFILMFAIYGLMLAAGVRWRARDGEMHPIAEVLDAAMRTLAPSVVPPPPTSVVSSAFLWTDALLSTAIYVAVAILAVTLPTLPHPHRDPAYLHNAAVLVASFATAKLLAFAWCVWPSRCGGGPLALEDIRSTGRNSSKADGSPLHQAAACGSTWLAGQYLAAGAELEGCDSAGASPLFVACAHGQVSTVGMLLERGAAINAPDAHGRTPLFAASHSGRAKVIELILDWGASIERAEASGNDGEGLLFLASGHGHPQTIDLLLKRGMHVDQVSTSGATPLHAAGANGHVAAIVKLLENGANVHHADTTGATALWKASSGGQVDAMRALLDAGAEVDAVDNKERATPLLKASLGGHVQSMELLIERGAAIDHPDAKGKTPLWHMAAVGGRAGARVLLNHQASTTTAVGKNAITPLLIACYHGHAATVEMLLEHGADLEQTDGQGDAALWVASHSGRVGVVTLLLRRGADVDHSRVNGSAPLGIASQNGFLDVMNVLLGHGAKVDRVGREGHTALFMASFNGHALAVELLLSHGASVTTTDHHGHTALSTAIDKGHEEVVTLLQRAQPAE